MKHHSSQAVILRPNNALLFETSKFLYTRPWKLVDWYFSLFDDKSQKFVKSNSFCPKLNLSDVSLSMQIKKHNFDILSKISGPVQVILSITINLNLNQRLSDKSAPADQSFILAGQATIIIHIRLFATFFNNTITIININIRSPCGTSLLKDCFAH